MKKLTTLLAIVFCANIVIAQTYTYNALPIAIPDSNINIFIPLTVSGVTPSYMSTSYGLKEVVVTIDHPWDSDLKISLQSPTGNVIVLSLHNGGTGSDYINTHFRMDGINGPIVGGNAPFTGTYIPDESLNLFNTSLEPANGVWNLVVLDAFPTEAGSLISYSLIFGSNPPPDPAGPVCSTTNAVGCVCRNGSNDCDLVPDIISSYIIIRNGWAEYPGMINFPNAIINIGAGPLEMKPTTSCYCDTTPVPCTVTVCPSGNAPKQRVNQRVYHKNASGSMTYSDYPAGSQAYHPSHGHVHAEDFLQFSLRTANANPDPLTWPIIGQSMKTGYCMINMGNCDSQDSICMSNGQVITGADIINDNLGSVSGCGSGGQGLFVGRYDLYGAGFGQSINLTNICNGNYYLVVNVDPNNNYIEEDETNNVVALPVQLTLQTGAPLNATFLYSSSGNFNYAFFNYTPGVTSYSWDFGDGTTATGNFPQHTYSVTGQYTVTLTVSNGNCSSSSTQVITITPVSITDINSGINSIQLYPNPSKENFTLEYTLLNESPVDIQIMNVLGQPVQIEFKGSGLAGKHNFDITGLSKGTYYIKLTANDKTFVQKMVKL